MHSGKPGVKFDTDAVEQALTDQIRLMDFEPYEGFDRCDSRSGD